ncbi:MULTISPECIES: hypothetical protein [Burkholderiaceae]|uniref:Uncharacterized protein n=2 Tax=Paraburkholderia TaxID=1822464 RepID=A0A7Z0B1V1_9BURK|nr:MULTISPECIES: hypothetical protein [Burkholderiaceae]NYH16970.1 hypothetical protein [Paraburkholderia bryophila]NYH27727.1 hypothetical protein [Paraburkholderia bryophila]
MSANTFAGQWIDGNNTKITITGAWDVVSVQYSGGRGPFQGYSSNLGAPVLTVNFTDDQPPKTGVLATDGKLLWSNNTVWHRG